MIGGQYGRQAHRGISTDNPSMDDRIMSLMNRTRAAGQPCRNSTLAVARNDVRLGATFDRFTDTLRDLHSIVDVSSTAPLSNGDPLVAETA